MVKGYLVFEGCIFAYEAILQVVLEILEKNNVTQPSQSSDAYSVHSLYTILCVSELEWNNVDIKKKEYS